MTDHTEPARRGEPTHAFTGIGDQNQLNPLFARRGEATDFPLNMLPPAESLPETAYQVVHDEAMLDGNSRLNLATFVGTWMDPHADRLYSETADKNMVDKDEYPQTAAIETRCWKMIATLWNAPDAENAIGTSTIGSSEACMLGGLALKRRWQLRAARGRASRRRSRTSSSPAPCRCAGRSSATTGTSSRATCRSPTSTSASTVTSSRSTSTRTPSASWRSWA